MADFCRETHLPSPEKETCPPKEEILWRRAHLKALGMRYPESCLVVGLPESARLARLLQRGEGQTQKSGREP